MTRKRHKTLVNVAEYRRRLKTEVLWFNDDIKLLLSEIQRLRKLQHRHDITGFRIIPRTKR